MKNSVNGIIRNLIKYRDLIVQLVQRDLKVKYRRSVLGYLWSLLNPLFMMLVLTAIFSAMFRNEIPNFPIYFMSGQIIFGFFSEATTTAMASIIGGGSLIRKVYMPKYIFPVAKTLSAFVNLLFSLLALVIILIITQVHITPMVLLFPFPLLYTLLFAMGIGMMLSVCQVFFRDTTHLYGVVLTAWMYFTPIFYPESALPPTLRILLKFNPLHHFIEYFRQVILYGQLPSGKETLICIGISFFSLLIGALIFRRHQDRFILYI